MFKELENNRPFLKMAFEGFAGDGKTFTAAQVAMGVHKLIDSKKPIAVYDTERAFKALKPFFDEAGIKVVINDENRSLASLNAAIKWCEEGGADVLLIDSISHVWEEFLRAYLNRPDKHGKEIKRNRLEFQDWGVIKPQWKEQFSTPFVMAKCHIIFTGRAGYEYTDEKNEDGKREIFKSGIKMKAENETAFEPDILVLMQKQSDLISEKKEIWREATVVKDRTTKIDGKSFRNPTFEDFYPSIKVLLDGTLRESLGNLIPDTFFEFENKYSKIAKDREIIVAELGGYFDLMRVSGTAAKDKQIRSWVLSQVFGQNSFEGLVKISMTKLREGAVVVKQYADQYKDYLSNCLDREIEIDKEYCAKMLKDILVEKKAEV